MKNNHASLSRRKLGSIAAMGGVTLLLGGLSGCSEAEQIIPVEVEKMPDGSWRVKNIDVPVYKGTKRIRFISGTRGWTLVKQEIANGALKPGPRFWLDGDVLSTIKPSEIEADGSVVTSKIPKGPQKLHVYVVMKTAAAVEPDTTTDGGCGGGGEIWER